MVGKRREEGIRRREEGENALDKDENGRESLRGNGTVAVHGTATDFWSSHHLAFHVAVDFGGVVAYVDFRLKLKDTNPLSCSFCKTITETRKWGAGSEDQRG